MGNFFNRYYGIIIALMILLGIISGVIVYTYILPHEADHGSNAIHIDVLNNKNKTSSDEDIDSDYNTSSINNYKKEIKTFQFNTSGYCYNPDYPEYGSSFELLTLNWEKLTGDTIKKFLKLHIIFDAEDDHYGSYSEKDTGDVFTLVDILYNKSTGEEEFYDGVSTFPGVCSAESIIELQNITSGTGLLPIYQMNISISNCGEYPVYWKIGIISEPDPGNAWRVELTLSYIPEE